MVPPQKKHRHKAAGNRRPKSNKSRNRPPSNEADCLAQADALEEIGKVDKAIALVEPIIVRNPDNVGLLERLATLYMEAGRPEDAENTLRSAIRLSPNSGFEKYAYLSQLLGPTEEAVALATKAIELIQAEISQLNNNASTNTERLSELRRYLSSSHCAVAEIGLAIIEDSNNPAVAASLDSRVESAIMAALGTSEPGSQSELEGSLTLANLRLSQGRKDEARTAMSRVMNWMSSALQALSSDNVDEDTVGDALESLPPFDIRIAIAKQLIEADMFQEAIPVLSSILCESDFNVEVWYMLAIAHWKLGNSSDARTALASTRAALHCPEGHDGELDEAMVDKLIAELDGSGAEKSQPASSAMETAME